VSEPSTLVALAYIGVPAVTLLAQPVIAWYVYRHHWETAGARSFVAVLAIAEVWMLALALRLLVTDPSAELTITTVERLALVTTLATIAVFASRYTSSGFHRRFPFRVAYAGAVGGFVATVVTNPWLGLHYTGVRLVDQPFHNVALQGGAGYYLALGLVVLVLGYSVAVLLRKQIASAGPSRIQLVLVLLGILAIALLEELGVAGFFPAGEIHHAGYGLLGLDATVALALSRYHLFDIRPVARTSVVERLQDPVIVLDSDRRVVDANDQATTLWSVLDGGLPRQLRSVCPDLADAVTLPVGTERTSTRLTLSIGGGRRHYSVQVSAIGREGGGDPDLYAIVLRDVTDLERSRWQLEKQNERLDQVAASVSHELRNPLNVASGRAELLERQLEAVDVDDDVRDRFSDDLGEIERATDRMAAIIEDILTIAREGKTVDDPEGLSLAAVARGGWRTVETADATLTVTGDRTLEADRSKLCTIFENLFRNAVDHGPDDVTLTVSPTETGFAVADDGPGIPERHRDQVFEYGYTSSDEGTGLGLSIVRTMAESHGWTVSLDDSCEAGTRLRFDTTGRDSATPPERHTIPTR